MNIKFRKIMDDVGKYSPRDIATVAHYGQFRWDKKTPYITHPESVAGMLSNGASWLGWLHDVLEDSGSNPVGQIYDDDLYYVGLDERHVLLIHNVTKRENEVYLDYLKRVCSDPISGAVKFADISHNLSNLKKGSMRDKYVLAQKFIVDYSADSYHLLSDNTKVYWHYYE